MAMLKSKYDEVYDDGGVYSSLGKKLKKIQI